MVKAAPELIRQTCPADVCGRKCLREECDMMRRCEMLVLHESYTCPGGSCPYLHGMGTSCMSVSLSGSCPRPSCAGSHDFAQERWESYKSGKSHLMSATRSRVVKLPS
ncbi:hypothetical protein VTN96DRAFT_10025 [Rasamsonia emersonii]